jgi:dystonin
MRFHAIQNVETALRFLRYKEIKLVNIRGEDIVDGNPKLTLGLIWTIILHFQVGESLSPPVIVQFFGSWHFREF